MIIRRESPSLKISFNADRRMKKLDVIRNIYKPNSAELNRCLALCRGLKEQGAEIHLHFFRPDPERNRDAGEDGFEYHFHWGKCLWKNKFGAYFYAYYAFIKYMLTLKEGDKVFFSGPSVYLPLFMFVNKLKRKRIRVYHETTEHPSVVKMSKVGILNKMYLAKCRSVDGLFVISTSLKTFFEAQGISGKKIHILNMVVDSNRFAYVEKRNVSEKYIAYCGTVDNNKDGVDDLIKAFHLVSNMHPDIKLYIIGGFLRREEQKSNLALIARLGLENRIVLTGMVAAADMPQLLSNAFCLALDRPDNLQAQYGFPTKLGEYLLTANPVVVTSVGDLGLFLKDKVSAYFARPSDYLDFADKLEYVITHPNEAREVGRRGKAVALSQFDYKVVAKKMDRLIFGEA